MQTGGLSKNNIMKFQLKYESPSHSLPLAT